MKKLNYGCLAAIAAVVLFWAACASRAVWIYGRPA